MMSRISATWLVVSGCMMVASALSSGGQQTAAAAQPPEPDKIRVLLVTGGHDFEQQPFLALFQSMADVTITELSYPDAAESLNPALVTKYDAIVFYDMWVQGITPRQQRAFVELLQQGIGVVALHHTLVAQENWPEYGEIIGGKYYLKDRVVDGKQVAKSAFAHDQDIPVRVAVADHPITRGLQDFTIHDEAYCHYDVAPAATVLLTTDHPKSDPELAWVKTYGNSRVCYIQLGHDHQAYENPNYRLLVARAIRWVAGRPTDAAGPRIELLNGTDLSGWIEEGKATWQVEQGMLVGQQGPGRAAGDLLTKELFDDFELTVTCRCVWPANSGVWFRYQSAAQAYQADILEYQQPLAWTGTLYCTGKMFLAINNDPALVDREGWNTLVIRAVGNRLTVLLNGTKVADVRDDTSRKGRIGFQIHAGDEFAKMRLFVKNATLRPL